MTRELQAEDVWSIRLFTWGETLAHFWILMFVISSELSATISMNWVAADGSNIVVMRHSERPDAGRWRRIGPEGEGGRYTFALAA
jgi:hypothetical protein